MAKVAFKQSILLWLVSAPYNRKPYMIRLFRSWVRNNENAILFYHLLKYLKLNIVRKCSNIKWKINFEIVFTISPISHLGYPIPHFLLKDYSKRSIRIRLSLQTKVVSLDILFIRNIVKVAFRNLPRRLIQNLNAPFTSCLTVQVSAGCWRTCLETRHWTLPGREKQTRTLRYCEMWPIKSWMAISVYL